MNKKGQAGFFIVFLIISLIFPLVALLMHEAYVMPEIKKSADNYCKSIGYDTFDSVGTKGIWPTDYIYVKCKFVENRRNIQGELNVNHC